MKKGIFRKLLITLAMLTASAAAALSVSACTTLYVGGNLTDEGAPIVARSEDYINSANKLFYISDAGTYKAGETYVGCDEYGAFEWTWSHDSYRFDAFTADILHDQKCPECGKTGHPSYTESGTNEKGVSVSATETLSGKTEILGNSRTGVVGVDPYVRTKTDGKIGIEETDIPTVILSEAATAKEGVDLLCKIYDEYGCYGGSGLFIADQNEVWYFENCSGTQYIALKLNNDLMFLEPNTSTIGEVDLDDTANVIASDKLIEVAETAGTFVGDKDANIINFRASYNSSNTANARLVNGLNFVNAEYGYVSQDLVNDNTKFCISNLDADKNIVPLYTNIKADRTFTVDDVVNYYKVSGISNTGNTDTAFFQLFKDRPVETATVEWVSLDTGEYNVFVPYYPLLTDSLYEGYGAAVGEAQKGLAERPESGMYYASVNSRTQATTYTLFPEDWETNYYWAFDALNNYITYAEQTDGMPVSKDNKAYVLKKLSAMQNEIYDTFAKLNADSDGLPTSEAATEMSASLAEKAHKLAVELVEFVRTPVVKYTDVKDSSWYYDSVNFVVKKGLFNGTSETTFDPKSGMTREMCWTVLARLDGVDTTPAEGQKWYEPGQNWAVEKGISDGTLGTDMVTREQLVTMLWRYAGSPDAEDAEAALQNFSDADQIHSWAKTAAAWAVEKGIINGMDKQTIDPRGTSTRAQVAAIAQRYCAL